MEQWSIEYCALTELHLRSGFGSATRESLRSRPRRRPRPRIRPRGVMEYWSVGVLRQLGIAPRVRGVEDAFRAILLNERPRIKTWLKPWAESYSPFGTKTICLLDAVR
jgi:hypothetical protein